MVAKITVGTFATLVTMVAGNFYTPLCCIRLRFVCQVQFIIYAYTFAIVFVHNKFQYKKSCTPCLRHVHKKSQYVQHILMALMWLFRLNTVTYVSFLRCGCRYFGVFNRFVKSSQFPSPIEVGHTFVPHVMTTKKPNWQLLYTFTTYIVWRMFI